MSLFHSSLVLLLLFSAPFGEPADSYFPLKDSWHAGELSKNIANPSHWADAIPCPQRKSTPPFMGKRQEQQQQQLRQRMPPGKSRVVSVPQGALLVERENDLSTYNWNSFGLRYGKRQALPAKEKL
ncbi:metastasis-suppressor KiSS-1 [Podarcis raffonei]|uniref:metastasis-suppressor KiSS-1 n=1 Tax=Podarcis raffonei TaxID=65483 RepID=UPI00232981CA|nr:metastasis-suppressor KiSS-1 [Podarcis raffonei]